MNIVESPKHRQSQTARINPDSRVVLYLVVGITTALALVSFMVSFAGLMAVAQWAALPQYLWWALPIFIDGAIIVYTMAMLIFRQRGESTTFAWCALIGFTAVSVFANGAHAYAEGDPSQWQTWIGTGLAGLAPAAVAIAIHTVALLLIEPHSQPQPLPKVKHELLTPEREQVAITMDPPTLPVQAPVAVPSAPVSARAQVKETIASPTTTIDEAIEPAQEQPNEKLPAPRSEPTPPAVRKPADDENLKLALNMSEQGLSQREIGEHFGVSKSTISRWLREARQESHSHLRLVSES